MDVSLPKRLAERVRWESVAKPETPRGRFVLYWMHHALRGHENPALDTAIHLARQNSLPLLVYQGLCEDHPHASDRHHAFVLQGARDVQRELAERDIRYVFHLQRRGAHGPHLRTLVGQAAIVVTEETPVEPVVGWLERLGATTATPILAVDTSCVVPMPMVRKRPRRASEFRATTGAWFAERVCQDWEDEAADCSRYDGPLPFVPLDLQDADLAKLIAQCAIDHTVAPVIDMPGGSRAGYSCWDAFRQQCLPHAAGSLLDAVAQQEAGRIYPYLHYGMVSPLRIARETHRWGAEELLDELLVWRELSHHFCFHLRDAVVTFEALPAWARETLKAHQEDPRPASFSWECLARAHSGDEFWDACQRSLLKHGQLHPAARMDWGKSVLPWVSTPERALQRVLSLNDRYALDGRDPHSYGRLLWCFGLFDGPSHEEHPVYGRVRPRESRSSGRRITDAFSSPSPCPLPGGARGLRTVIDRPSLRHLEGVDLDQFESWVDRPVATTSRRVAVIGAGMAGLVAARTISDHGLEVTIFEKSRGVGGRLATRQTPSGAALDHGAQYFTVCDDSFARYVRSWIDGGIVAPWTARIVELNGGVVGTDRSDRPRYVGVPSMSALAEHLASDLSVQRETCVGAIERHDGAWRLTSVEGRELGEFDIAIVNCPPPQAAELLPGSEAITERIRAVEMASCWAVMVEVESSLKLDFDAASVHNNPLGWIARNDSKPGRGGGEAWVLHATAEWSQDHLNDDPQGVLAKLLDAFTAATAARIGNPISISAHQWRYARPIRALEEGCLWDSCLGLGACGDWCVGPRVEGAFLSGAAMAGSVMRHLTIDRPAPLLARA